MIIKYFVKNTLLKFIKKHLYILHLLKNGILYMQNYFICFASIRFDFIINGFNIQLIS